MTTVDRDEEEAHFAELRDTARAIREWDARRFAKMLTSAVGQNPAIEFLDVFKIDDYGVITIGYWDDYSIQIMPMIFNDRIVMTPGRDGKSYGYDHGWCYDKGGAAFLAAAVWNPQTEAEPAGYKKRATAGLRTAGERADQDRADSGLAFMLTLYGLLEQQR